MLTPSLFLLLSLGGGVPVPQLDVGAGAQAQPAQLEDVKKRVKPKPKPPARKKKPVKREIDDLDDSDPDALTSGEVAMHGVASGTAAGLSSLVGLVLGGVLGAGVGTVLGCISCMATLTICTNSWLATCIGGPIACGVGTLSLEGVAGLLVAAASVAGGALGWLGSGLGARRRPPVWAPFAFAVPLGIASTVVAFLASGPFLGVAAYYMYSVYRAQNGSAALRGIASDWAMYSGLAFVGAAAAFFLVQVIGSVVSGVGTGVGTAVVSRLLDGRGNQDDPDDPRPIPPAANQDDDDYIPPADRTPDDTYPPMQPYEPFTPAPSEPSPILPE
jgi:hypothetical protein